MPSSRASRICASTPGVVIVKLDLLDLGREHDRLRRLLGRSTGSGVVDD
jgi:hypothetical protein